MNDTAAPWVDPELIAAGQLLQEKGLVAPDRTVASFAEVRAATDRIGAFLGEGSVPLSDERDLSLPGPHGQVPCRLYLPDDAEKPPLISTRMAAGSCRAACRAGTNASRTGPPERRRRAIGRLPAVARTPFPAAFEEMVAMIRLAAREGAGFGIDPTRLAVGGDSAGANLALAAALAMRDAGERALSFMLLIYGCFSTDTESQSWQRFGHGAGLSQTQMRWIWETYLERPEQQTRLAGGTHSREPRGPSSCTSCGRQPRSAARRQQPACRRPPGGRCSVRAQGL